MEEECEELLLMRQSRVLQELTNGQPGANLLQGLVRRLHEALSSGENFAVFDLTTHISSFAVTGFRTGGGRILQFSSGKLTGRV